MLSRVRGGTLIFALDEYRGDFEIGAKSDLSKAIMFSGSFEPQFAKLCVDHLPRDRDAVDVGANVGLYSVLIAKLISGRVLAIEPTRQAFELLTRNLERNDVGTKVICDQAVASDSRGETFITVCIGREEYSTVGSPHEAADGVETEQQRVRAVTIDDECERLGLIPGFIKIDVEGFEYQVLKGALNTLRKHRPVLLIEVNHALLSACGTKPADVFQLLRGSGYKLSHAMDPSQDVIELDEGYVLARPYQ
jgi:FkbM family methyltransferase